MDSSQPNPPLDFYLGNSGEAMQGGESWGILPARVLDWGVDGWQFYQVHFYR